jgi:hypothetical protein
MPVQINETDDHALHLMEHELPMKDPAFDSKPPEVQMAYKMHRQAHKQAQAMEMQGLDPTTGMPDPTKMPLAPPPEGMNGGPPLEGEALEGVQPPPAQ